jgi:hypothetical protein
MTRIPKTVAVGVALAGLVSFYSLAGLADGPQAIATAAQHAGLAANSGDIDGVHRHLHHTLNCLVGPEGEGFDQSAGNPCQAAGGAIPQTSDAAMRTKLTEIAGQVRSAIGNGDLAAAKTAATSVQEMLAAE